MLVLPMDTAISVAITALVAAIMRGLRVMVLVPLTLDARLYVNCGSVNKP